jgi:ABC-type branched-subunit amino acid transport system ATPase component
MRSSAQRRGQVDAAERAGGQAGPDAGSVTFEASRCWGASRYEINQLGVARVFQTPEIFGDLTVFENMLIPALRPSRRHLPDARL